MKNKDDKQMAVEVICDDSVKHRKLDEMKKHVVTIMNAREVLRLAKKYGDDVPFLDALMMENASKSTCEIN